MQLIKDIFFSLGYGLNLTHIPAGFVAMARVHPMLIFCFTQVQEKFTLSNLIYAQCILRVPGAATVTTNISCFDLGVERVCRNMGKN